MPDTRSSFDAKDHTLKSFVTDRGPSSFKIPDYQRRFVWESKQLTDFIDSIVRNKHGYYIGTIVVVRPNHRSYDIEIIDGQQRLTALTFCIKILYDILNSTENYKMKTETEDFEELFVFKEKELRLVFNDQYFNNHLKVLLKEANPLQVPELQQWFKNIQARSESNITHNSYLRARQEVAQQKAVTRLFNTYKDIQNYFTKLSTAELSEAFSKFMNVQLIEIVCEDYQVVNSLFEGLNSKGIQLNNAELIKNKLFEQINTLNSSTEIKNSLKELWDEMDLLFFTESDKRLIDKFLRHLWISKFGYIAGPSLYDKYVELIRTFQNEVQIQSWINELRLYADYYIAIRSTDLRHVTHRIVMDPSVYVKFNDFGRLNNDQVYEILLTLLRLIKNDPHRQLISTADIRSILAQLWAFCFRLQFIPVNTSKYERKFAELSLNLETWSRSKDPIAASALHFIQENLSPLVKDDEQFIDNVKTQLEYKSSKQNNRLLEKIFYDLFRAYDNVKNLDRSYEYINATIEHILPQKPQEWGYKKLEVSDIVNNVGNLTLLDEYENTLADNKPFGHKLETVYSKNKYMFNKDLSQYKEGFISTDLIVLSRTIENRADAIARQLNSIYKP